MTLLLAGLLLFLGAHSLRIFAEDWRQARIALLGVGPWRGLYSLASVVGLVLIVMGYTRARAAGLTLYDPPVWLRHGAQLLMLPALIFLVAAYVPGTRIKAALKHPMLAAVMLWSVAHLLANGRVAELLLFGAFGIWAVLDYRVARGRDLAAGTVFPIGPMMRDGIAIVIGTAAWLGFVFGLHAMITGIALMPR